jgi:hypothetical protein
MYVMFMQHAVHLIDLGPLVNDPLDYVDEYMEWFRRISHPYIIARSKPSCCRFVYRYNIGNCLNTLLLWSLYVINIFLDSTILFVMSLSKFSSSWDNQPRKEWPVNRIDKSWLRIPYYTWRVHPSPSIKGISLNLNGHLHLSFDV